MSDPVTPAGRRARRAEAVRELGATARELIALDARADRAAARQDAERLADVAEELLPLHVRFAEQYRTLLAIGLRDPQPAAPVTQLPGTGRSRSPR